MAMVQPTPDQAAIALLALKLEVTGTLKGSLTRRIKHLKIDKIVGEKSLGSLAGWLDQYTSNAEKIASLCKTVLDFPNVSGGREALLFGMEALREAECPDDKVRTTIDGVIASIKRQAKEVFWGTVERPEELSGTDAARLLQRLMQIQARNPMEFGKQSMPDSLEKNLPMQESLVEKLPVRFSAWLAETTKCGMDFNEQFALLCALFAQKANTSTPPLSSKGEEILRFGAQVLSECTHPVIGQLSTASSTIPESEAARVQKALEDIQKALARQKSLFSEHRIQPLKTVPLKIFSAIRWLFQRLIPRWLTPSYWRSRSLKQIELGSPITLQHRFQQSPPGQIDLYVRQYESLAQTPERIQMACIRFWVLVDFKKAGLWVVLSLLDRVAVPPVESRISREARLQLLASLLEPMRAKLGALSPDERVAIATFVKMNVKPSDNPVVATVISLLRSETP